MKCLYLSLLFIFALPAPSFEQIKNYSFGKGIHFTAKDSSFSSTASFRFQTLFIGDWASETYNWKNVYKFSSNVLIRRARLKFNGFAYSPKLTYKLELGLSNRDVKHSNDYYFGNAPNFILDAYLKWNFYKGFSIKAGQFKLPGNRERLISSSAMQFVDRSLLNSNYTLDRDVGISLHYNKTFGKQFEMRLKAAVSKGEGRNVIQNNVNGYETTFKAEFLPFGAFKNKGEYVGSAIDREEQPKLAVAFTFDRNDGAIRTNGNKGGFIQNTKNGKVLLSGFADFMFKYKGISIMGEYAIRRTSDNIPFTNLTGIYNDTYFTGSGINFQGGYMFKNKLEIGGRFTTISPQNSSVGTHLNQYSVVLSKFIKGNSLKVQTDVGYLQQDYSRNHLTWRVQVEFSL